MVERLRFAVDHIRLAIRDRFAIAYTAPDPVFFAGSRSGGHSTVPRTVLPLEGSPPRAFCRDFGTFAPGSCQLFRTGTVVDGQFQRTGSARRSSVQNR
jgi:hypothetical protein